MTFYELKGRLGCEKPIFHLITGEVQKAEYPRENLHHAQMPACSPARASQIFSCWGWWKSGKQQQLNREDGVKATGRKGSQLKASWHERPSEELPSEPQAIDQIPPQLRPPFPEEGHDLGCLQLLSFVLEWSTPQSIDHFYKKYPTSRENKVYSAKSQAKPFNSETMQAKAFISIDRMRETATCPLVEETGNQGMG